MIIVVGLSHQSAPIEVREKLALTTEGGGDVAEALVSSGAASEAFVVSTCNRVEVIAVPSGDADACERAVKKQLTGGLQALERHIYAHREVQGVRHLVRVASSLDSLVVGEPQILGQLKQGFEEAKRRGLVGPTLHPVFARAARAAKMVRSRTTIGMGQVSVPSIAVDLAAQIFGSLSGHTAVLVGSGEMGQSVARLLQGAGASLLVVGRTLEKVSALADAVGGKPYLMADLPEVLVRADVVISSTSALEPVILRRDVERASRARRGRNLFFIDLAVPRDVEPSVGELDGTFLYNVDDLQGVAAQSAETRKKEADRATDLVEEAVRDWQRWADGQQATPTIKALRARLRLSFEVELERSLKGRLRELDESQRQAVFKMLDAGINRILHAPTVRLREEATRQDGPDIEGLARTLNDLFELDELPEDAMEASSIRPPAVTPNGELAPDSGQTASGQSGTSQTGS